MNPSRAGLIRLIHVAKRDLGLDDGAYQAIIQAQAGGKSSSAECTLEELDAVVRHMKKSGFQVRHAGGTKTTKAKPSRALAKHPTDQKIRALWLFLHELGVVRNPSEASLAAYLKRLTKVDALQWLTDAQAKTVIEALKKWAMRFLPGQVEALAKQVADAIQAGDLVLPAETLNALRALAAVAKDRQTFDPMHTAWDALTAAMKGDRHE